jgi:hypothetical protein
MTQGDRASISKSLLKSKVRADQDLQLRASSLEQTNQKSIFQIHNQHQKSKKPQYDICEVAAVGLLLDDDLAMSHL